jgi:hypothetical protein
LAEIPNEPTAKTVPVQFQNVQPALHAREEEIAEGAPGPLQELRMHDNRAECCVRLLDKGYSPLQVTKGVSLHLDIKTMTNATRASRRVICTKVRPALNKGRPFD